MNRSVQHAFYAEEVMAYLDGELEPKRAAALAGHLEHCVECQSLAKELRLVSGRMLDFEIEPAPPGVTAAVVTELNSPRKLESLKTLGFRQKIRVKWHEFAANRKVWGFAAAFAVVAMTIAVGSVSTLHRSSMANFAGRQEGEPSAPAPQHQEAVGVGYKSWLSEESKGQLKSREAYIQRQEQSSLASSISSTGPAASPPSNGGELAAPESVGPMVVQTASLSIVAKNYDEANPAVQKLVAARGGYIEKLDAKAQSGDSRSLSVALRVPAKELDGLLADLRKLGHVEEESKSNEEVSAEYVDLQARLKVAQATERRLVELLGTRTGRLEDVLDVERELARVRSEVESMQGQSALMLHRVSYATVQVELSEEYHQKLQSQSMGAKLRNALLAGVQNLLDGIVALLIFLLNYGLSILFWLALILVPAWLILRRMRARRIAKSGSSFQTT